MAVKPRDVFGNPETPAERRVDQMFAGNSVAADVPLDVQLAEPGRDYEVRAAFLMRRMADASDGGSRWAFWRRNAAPPVIRVVDSLITGTFDLRALDFPYLLEFVRCRFAAVPDIRQANVAGCQFDECWLPGLAARNLRSDNDVMLRGSIVDGGTVDLTDAHVAGSLILDDTELRNPGDRALHADRLSLDGAMLATRMRVEGEVRFPGMRSGGNINLSGAQLTNPDGFALNGNGIRVGGHLLCGRDPYTGDLFHSVGRVFLPSAQVASDLVLRAAVLEPATDPVTDPSSDDPFFDPVATLIADRCDINGNIVLDNGFLSTGTIRIINARIGGSLRLTGSTVDMSGGAEDFTEPRDTAHAKEQPGNYPDRALHLDGTEISGDFDLRRASLAGQTRLVEVSVHGSVLLDEAKLSNRGADVLEGRRFKIGGNLDCRHSTVFGSMLLQGASIGANLDLRASRFVAPGTYTHDHSPKPSVDIRSATIRRDFVCAADRSATPRLPFSAVGEIRLVHAEVGREVNFDGAQLGRDPAKVAINGFGLRTQQLRLTVDQSPRGRVDLRQARCAVLDDNAAFWAGGSGRMQLDDFRYDSLATPIEVNDDQRIVDRLRWLENAIGTYSPGPYDQCAAMLRANGNEEHATTVLIAKQRKRYRALADGYRVMGPGVLFWSWMQRAMVGYGYRPTRALVWLLACLALGTAWFALHPLSHEINADDHLNWNPVLYTLDLLVPIVDFGHKNRWQISGPSQWISVLLIAAGWILATTVAAGVTRMLRRNT
ncbi:oxidoreductase [Labedaea rhizosphaerae]|uniref:Membrane-associated oxidoreductase n=1 Tax=Labedaea rhizosphaerae TaxID=598644 RepID=A0A4R6SMV7_LABRH|nr:oxidoreductase [Labedaea rhizosphaerae]TDQ05284.1 hypothetical protein EV186_1011253 [Labedaea rhizosphaerae]